MQSNDTMRLTQRIVRNSRWIVAMTLVIACFSTNAHAVDNVVIVIDDSGSMAERLGSNQRITRMDAAKRALLDTLQDLPENTNVGVLALNGGRNARDHWVIPLGPANVSAIGGAIASLRADGSTPLGAAIKTGTDALLAARAEQHYGRFRLLIVSDGEASDVRKVDRYLPDILRRGITIDVIGVDMAGRHSLATQVHSYRAADDPNALSKAIQTILAESGSDSGDAGDSDFELLEGFPDEIAAAALVALSESGNHPIDTRPPAASMTTNETPAGSNHNSSRAANSDGASDFDSTSATSDGTPVNRTPGQAAPVSTLFSGICICFGASFLIVCLGIVLVIRTASRSRRKR